MTEECAERLIHGLTLEEWREAKQADIEEKASKSLAEFAGWTTTKQALYGLTPEAYLDLYESHGGSCAVCGSAGRLCVDHNHITGEIRGLLCHTCNLALGAFRGDEGPDLLRAAVEYLE
jgi:hypothetical protein